MEQEIKRRGRPRGRNRADYTITLSHEVKALLSNHDNASQFIEMLVRQAIKAADDVREVDNGATNS